MNRVSQGLLAGCAAVLLAGLVSVVAGEPAAPPPVSKFAPADDLLRQVDALVDSCREGLADGQTYNDKSRQITKDAHTLAALALVLAQHDQDHRLKNVSPALVGAAQQLAKAKDYEAAKRAFAAVDAAAAGTVSAQPEVRWERVASLGQLMKQVTFVNNRLKRNMRRFDERKEDNLRDAAVLAAIAQVSNYDTHEVKDQADLDKWYQWCDAMRDAAGQINEKIRAGDRAGTDAALVNLGKSCEGCHETFRVRTAP